MSGHYRHTPLHDGAYSRVVRGARCASPPTVVDRNSGPRNGTQLCRGAGKVALSVDNMQRIALATVGEAALLNSIVKELTAHLVLPSQMCVVGYGPQMLRLQAESASNRLQPAEALLGQLCAVGRIDSGELIASARGPCFEFDFDAEREPQGLLFGMEPLMLDGTVALLVESRTISEFAVVTRLLLRFSSHRVRTREVACPPG